MPKLFIGNIPHASSEQELQEWIESHGFLVESTEVIYDRLGNPRGFGFVNLRDDAEVQRGIAVMNGQRMKGRVLTVNKATPLTARLEQSLSGPKPQSPARFHPNRP